MTRVSRPFRPIRARTAAVAAGTATALFLPLAGCGDPDDGGPAAHRPSPKPSPAWRTDPASVAALGDSITVGFDACSVLSDCPAVSWATGTDPQVNSVARRLVKDPATHSWNFAKTGALIRDLPGQVDLAVRKRPELVTVLVGANDACRNEVGAMTSEAAFRAGFESSLRKLRRALPKTQVYVAAVPDLMRLWSQGRQNQLGKQIWKLGICGSMLRDPDDLSKAADTRRQSVRERVQAYNKALESVCAKDALCRFDRSVFDFRFTGAELSAWDWFHPGREGQRELAEMAFREITRKGT
ncbi:SGNH/GDSL hydrolase family protein [Streptomyces rimosus]|uniref:SGNH/GDSL hydrolase family protein n=1 Tax=Streptomyces rimosus TaxID=1927 RepID=UPI0004C500A7|nr:GDSL-type esterase/lipase family protein [Streptomyces rimosus]